MARKYYSARKGNSLDLDNLKILFGTIFAQLQEKQYFAEAFGIACVDAGWTPGFVGASPDVYFLRHLRKPSLWPIEDRLGTYSEDDLFDVIELLYDLVSKPVDGRMHSYGGCGMHWEIFDRSSGRKEYRDEVNEVLGDYQNGFELTADGEVMANADPGLETLVSAELPSGFEDELRRKMHDAVRLFRARHSSLVDRRTAVRLLADVFERLRPDLKLTISQKDENDLFNIANNFAIRHDNDHQKRGYDQALWLSWMFYFYLATLHYSSRKLMQAKEETDPRNLP